MGVADGDQPCTAVAQPLQTPRRIRAARPGLRLVHRRLRHRGLAGCEVASRRIGVVSGAAATRAGSDLISIATKSAMVNATGIGETWTKSTGADTWTIGCRGFWLTFPAGLISSSASLSRSVAW